MKRIPILVAILLALAVPMLWAKRKSPTTLVANVYFFVPVDRDEFQDSLSLISVATINWRDCLKVEHCGPSDLEIRFINKTGAGYAVPNAGAVTVGHQIIVFWPTVLRIWRQTASSRSRILGNILAHEVRHTLGQHHGVGIMKPHWKPQDF